ncbi:MAG: BlaI/MecI/CopY family transcriptional regulator [Bacteroidales bacterium]|nr:BlaI/MecI/CopY family transcriptional regulator [Eubacterium sp.]MCM1235755.1 BlaI/MecI/CopY family transcriptional regulator [Ruminococcus flavefaciens]MCM1266569.1 BlaI/MecI/CopY family transcriptional regulator [Bacteroidales bacterium]MCM1414665.1 BlaI/MecI/CopY family transcriptional regulator [bacterium]
MSEIILSDSEKEILEWMWKEDKEYSYRDFALQFGEDSEKGWKKQTLSTFLTRMEQKGVIFVRCEGEARFQKRRYFRALSRQQYERARARHLLDSYFEGSLNQFMVALNGGEKLCGDEADELRKFLEDM